MKLSMLLSSVVFPLAYMNGTCETVVIASDAGPVMINKTDFNPDVHTLHDDAAPVDPDALRDDGPTIADFVAAGYPASKYPPQGYTSTVEEIAAAVADEAAKLAAAPAPATLAEVATEGGATPQPAAPTLSVMSKGKKHFVTDAAGELITDVEGILAEGYASAQEAWNAILALTR